MGTTAMKEKPESHASRDPSGIWVPAGCSVSVVDCSAASQPAAGVLVGLGIGFLMMFLTKMFLKR